MKRTALIRRTPLETRRGLDRGPRRREAIYSFACDIEGESVTCWLAQFADTPCAGRLQRVHLIAKQYIRRLNLTDLAGFFDEVTPEEIIWSPDVWRPGCEHHHAALDVSKRLVIPRSAIPPETERFAKRFGLTTYLDRHYGDRSVLAAAGQEVEIRCRR